MTVKEFILELQEYPEYATIGIVQYYHEDTSEVEEPWVEVNETFLEPHTNLLIR